MTRIFDFVKILSFAVFFALLVHYFLLQPFIVSDNALAPQYAKGDLLLISRLPYFLGNFHRFDVVIDRNPAKVSEHRLRKIIGMPGERVSINDGILAVYGADGFLTEELPIFGNVALSMQNLGRIDDHEFYTISYDGFENSTGLLDIQFIIGKPLLRIYPLSRINIL